MIVKYSSSMNENYKDKFLFISYYFSIALYLILLIYALQFFTWSDQYFYKLYYDGLFGLNFVEAYNSYVKMLGSREPMYFIYTYLAQFFMSKKVFDIHLNLIFFSTVLVYMNKINMPRVMLSLLLTSVYFLSVFFITERLKLSVLFLILYFIYSSNKYSWLFILLAVLSHAQILIILPFLYLYSDVRINFRNKSQSIILICIFLLLALFLTQHLARKLPLYFLNFSVINIFKPAFFAALSYFFIAERRHLLAQFYSIYVPVILVSVFLGNGRMTLIAFLGSVYFWSFNKKNVFLSTILYAALLYFSVRGLTFLLSATVFGDAYAISIMNIYKYIFSAGLVK